MYKDKNSKKIPFGRALLIIMSSLLCSGSLAIGGYLFLQKYRNERLQDSRFSIKTIAQICSKGQYLKTGYFAEWLNLSIDQPTNLYQFDLKEAKKKLLSSPLIHAVELKKIFPNTLYVEYETREPIAFLDDFKNTAIDLEGYLFPFKPFFTPKKLPKIYVGMSEIGEAYSELAGASGNWGESLNGHRIDIAFKIYKLLKQYCNFYEIEIIKIDTSKAFALSYGQREIVVILGDHIPNKHDSHFQLQMLRLTTKNYAQELSNYFILRNDLATRSEMKASNTTLVNFRITDLAFIVPNLLESKS